MYVYTYSGVCNKWRVLGSSSGHTVIQAFFFNYGRQEKALPMSRCEDDSMYCRWGKLMFTILVHMKASLTIAESVYD